MRGDDNLLERGLKSEIHALDQSLIRIDKADKVPATATPDEIRRERLQSLTRIRSKMHLPAVPARTFLTQDNFLDSSPFRGMLCLHLWWLS